MDKTKIDELENVKDVVSEGTSLEETVKAKYPKVYAVEVELEEIGEEYTFYFVKPSTLSLNRVVKDMNKKALSAMKTFTLESIVAEQKQEYDELIKEYPALAGSIGGKLMGLLGATDNVSLKKL